MKKIFTLFAALTLSVGLWAQAPANNPGVMLQGFYYDSYNASNAIAANGESYGTTKWTDLTSQAQEIAETFDMIWLPPSARSEEGTGYHPKQWSNQSGDWGSKAQLVALIGKFKEINPNMKVIADIVINHKSGNSWIDFDNEDFGTYGKFTLYESGHTSRYVCQDDEVSKQAGWKATGAKDQGYDYQCESSGGYCAARDLDHSNSYLRDAIKAYLKWMKGEIGYDGWRYDYVKGYLGKYNKEYNQAAGAYFSVGDFKDADDTALTHWINETGKTSNAFDYALKSIALNDGLVNKDYAKLAGEGAGCGLVGDNTYKQYAVSFVDNHDSFIDDDTKFKGDWAQANAYIIAMPGTPCVFYPHWVQCKEDIKKMIAVRKACGITNTSAAVCSSTSSYFKGMVTGTKGNLVVFIGDKGACPAGYHYACSGDGWIYYTNLAETASITADVEKIEFEQKKLEGTVTDEKEIVITGEDLTDPIKAEMKGKSIFSVTGTFSTEGGTMTVSYDAEEVGDYKDTIILTSFGASLEIPVSVSIVIPTDPAEYMYTEYENWQIKCGPNWEWSDNMTKVEEGLFKMEIEWNGTGFNIKSDENPIKKDWYALDDSDITIGEELMPGPFVDVYLKVIDNETVAIGVGVDPTVSTDVIDVINAEDVPNGAIIKDGKVYIIRDGKVYNLQGSEIKIADEILKSVNF